MGELVCATDKPRRTVSMSQWYDGSHNCADGSDESALYIVEQIKAGKIENLCGQRRRRRNTSVDFRFNSAQEIEESLRSIREQLEKAGLGGVGRGDCITTSGGPVQQANITVALESITMNQAEFMGQVTRLTRLLAAGSGEQQGCQTDHSYAVAIVTLGWVVLQGLSMAGYATRDWPGWGQLWQGAKDIWTRFAGGLGGGGNSAAMANTTTHQLSPADTANSGGVADTIVQLTDDDSGGPQRQPQ